jgi:phosphoribosyl 1,2-cyclic phosphate phosphodiesterase
MARFSYCFIAPEGSDYPPILDRHSIEAGESRIIEGKGGSLELFAFDLRHGNIPALGYRIGDAAYTPDVNDIPAESWPLLEDLDLWIIDGLRYTGHPSHFSVNEALSWIGRFKPRSACHRILCQRMTACGWCWRGRSETGGGAPEAHCRRGEIR